MKVHLLYKPDPEQMVWLKSTLNPEIKISTGKIQQVQHQTKVLVAGRPTIKELDSLPDLEILIIPWSGVPEETQLVLKQFPELRIYNLHHNAGSTAEMAIGLLIAVAKQIVPCDQGLRQGNWLPRYQKKNSILLAGKNALVLGYGEIGKKIKLALEGLGVNVRIIKRSIKDADKSDYIYTIDKFHDLLPTTEILILALPLTDQTEDLINDKELGLLPKSAILVNISRGKIVNQQALFNALKNKKIYGAGIDVWYNYPADEPSRTSTFPGDFPFHELENIVLSPHRAGHVQETEKLRFTQLGELLNAIHQGGLIPNQVDLERGY
jgi:phosphoglycerate dehydrogenase-like enzyme